MTAADLIAVLSRRTPTRRVLLPAREWGWSELAGVQSQLLTFAPLDDPAMGVWVAERLHDAEAYYERCLLLVPQPNTRRRRSAGARCDATTAPTRRM
jgi:hypothetical protein